MKIAILSEYGYDEALFGLGLSFGKTSNWDFKKFNWTPTYAQIEERAYKLTGLGKGHDKFLRMLMVTLDITAPLYWWKEFDTYKVGTVANSCSTMHKIAEKEFALNDFSHDHLTIQSEDVLLHVIKHLNMHRMAYLTTNTDVSINCTRLSDEACARMKKDIWWQMIQLLPSSYNQKRTVMLSYEVLANIYKSRRNHKLDEWHTLCDWIEQLPYSELIIGGSND